MVVRSGLQVARVPALLVLLMLAGPAQARLRPALNALDIEAVRWPALALVALTAAFMVVVLVGRRIRHPAWLLVVEAILAGLLGLLLPLWDLWPLTGRLAWPPAVLEPLAEAFSHPAVLTFGQAANWLTIVLALAWLVLVAATAFRQARYPGAAQPRPHLLSPRAVAVGATLQAGRILVLLALLLIAGPLTARWIKAMNLLDYPALSWIWLALAAIALVFLIVAVLGRGRRTPGWLLVGEGLAAVVVAVALLLPGFVDVLVRPGQPVEPVVRWVNFAFDLGLAEGRWFFLRALAIAWLIVVVEAAARQLLESVRRPSVAASQQA